MALNPIVFTEGVVRSFLRYLSKFLRSYAMDAAETAEPKTVPPVEEPVRGDGMVARALPAEFCRARSRSCALRAAAPALPAISGAGRPGRRARVALESDPPESADATGGGG